jgi:hypothetical protein
MPSISHGRTPPRIEASPAGTQVLRQDLTDNRCFRRLELLLVRGPTGGSTEAPIEAARAAVKRLLNSRAVPVQSVEGQPRLDAAAAALLLAEAADRLARAEIVAAREVDGATWEQVGTALGMSRQSAHERFRTGPDGLHSRWFKKATAQKSDGSSGPTISAVTGRTGRRRTASS